MLLLPERSLALVVCELENFLQVSLLRDCTVMYPCCRSTASTTRLANSSSRGRSNWSAWTTTPGPRSSSTATGREEEARTKWLIVADQMGNHLEVLDVNPTNGTLSPRQVVPTQPQPSFVWFGY